MMSPPSIEILRKRREIAQEARRDGLEFISVDSVAGMPSSAITAYWADIHKRENKDDNER